MERKRGFEIAKGFENQGINLPIRKTKKSAGYDGIILNAGAYTHTSIAIRDALLSINAKFIEVHLSNVFAREPFRHHSYLSDIALGVIAGFREDSYLMAVDYFANGVWQW